VHDLTVVTMANVLQNGRAADLQLHGATGTLNQDYPSHVRPAKGLHLLT